MAATSTSTRRDGREVGGGGRVAVTTRDMAERRGLEKGGAEVEVGTAQLAHCLHLHYFHSLTAN
jgi:hypothetical protein